jgi:hypothetical protein
LFCSGRTQGTCAYEKQATRSGERLARLAGQAVHQVDVHAGEARVAAALVDVQRALAALPAADGHLHGLLEVLHAQADAVEAGRAQERHLFGRGDARVDLQRDLGVGRQVERAAEHRQGAAHLGLAQVVRRAAAPMELHHAPVRADQRGDHRQFLLDTVEILGDGVLLARDQRIAPAVEAMLRAEGQVQVDGQFVSGLLGQFGQRLAVLGVAESLLPGRHRRVARVARAGGIVLLDEVGRYVQGHGRPS